MTEFNFTTAGINYNSAPVNTGSEISNPDASQFAIYYPNVGYMLTLREINKTFSYEEFVDKELVGVFEYRAIRIAEQLGSIQNGGEALRDRFLELHKQNVDALKQYSARESQASIYEIETLLKEAKSFVKNPEQLEYDAGFFDEMKKHIENAVR